MPRDRRDARPQRVNSCASRTASGSSMPCAIAATAAAANVAPAPTAGRGRGAGGRRCARYPRCRRGCRRLRTMVATAGGRARILGAICRAGARAPRRPRRPRLALPPAVVLVATRAARPSQPVRRSGSWRSARQQRGLRRDQVGGERGGDLLARLAEQRRGVQARFDRRGTSGSRRGSRRSPRRFRRCRRSRLECRDRHVLEHPRACMAISSGATGHSSSMPRVSRTSAGGLHRRGWQPCSPGSGCRQSPPRPWHRPPTGTTRRGSRNGERHGGGNAARMGRRRMR